MEALCNVGGREVENNGLAVAHSAKLGIFVFYNECQIRKVFVPRKEEVKITYDFDGNGEAEEVSKSLRDWTLAMNDANGFANNLQARLTILSALETSVLSAYQCIPLYTDTSSRVLSYKVDYGYEEYNMLYGYGGVRYMTYNYDDESFEEYIDDQGNSLKYQ